MRRCLCRWFLLSYSFLFLCSSSYGDISDVVVVLDTSGSLLSYYDEINGRILKEIFTNYARKNDEFHLISFNSQPRLEMSKTISSESDFFSIASKFSLIYPLAKDSDILLALDFVKDYLLSLPISRNKKLIFISDGLFSSIEYSTYTQDDFKRELNRFSTYFVNNEKVKVYYIKLPISSNQIVLDLQDNLFYFANTSHIASHSLICKLPPSLKKYLWWNEIGQTAFGNENHLLNNFNISNNMIFENMESKETYIAVENIEIEDIDFEIPTDTGSKLENIERQESEKNIDEVLGEQKINFEKYERKNAVSNYTSEQKYFTIDESNLIHENDFHPLSTSNVASKIRKKNFDLDFPREYVFFITGVFLALIVFFIMKKYSNKSDEKEHLEFNNPSEKEIYSPISEDMEFEQSERKNEILCSSTEEHFYVDQTPEIIQVGKNKDVLQDKQEVSLRHTNTVKESPKVLTKILANLEAVPKEEKILLHVKTIETKLTTEYSPTFFTLSPDTKKAFAKGSAIENMLSLLNSSYVGDVFYRFKHSLYTKKYVKNVDITKKNYLEMFVANQRRSIGMRNTHPLVLNKTFYIGGRKTDDFLIFLVSLPRKLACVYYDEKEIVFKILEPKYFPYETQLKIRNPIDRFFVIISEKNYPIYFMFRIYEKEISPSSKIIAN